MVLSYYNKFDDFAKLNINTINSCLYCLLLTPILFIGNSGPILVVSIISLISILNDKKLFMFDNKDEVINSQEDDASEEAQTSEEEEEEDEEEEEEEEDEEEEDEEDEEEEEEEEEKEKEEEEEEEKKEEQASDEEDIPELIETVDSYLIILAVKNTNHKYILTTTNELIATYKSKLLELGSIKLNSIIINLIVLEIDVSESDIQQLKQDNELFDYTIFDDTLNILEDVKLECIWRRYKHILKENEYKDNTYTIL
jgi:flagellar biosynthesis GTPase FlhF